MTSWVVNELVGMQALLLEQTKIYYYATTSLTSVRALCDDLPEMSINPEQSFNLKLYVKQNVFDSLTARTNLETLTISTINSMIATTTVNISDIAGTLRGLYGTSVISFDITKLGGDQYSVIRLVAEHGLLCVKKRLVLQADQTMVVNEDINIDYHIIA